MPKPRHAEPPVAPDAPLPPDHLVRIPGSSWALWRCVGLRSAGFPLTGVLALADESAATAADELLRAEADVAQARRAALDALYHQIKQSDGEHRRSLRKLSQSISKGRLPDPVTDDAAVEAFRAALLRLAEARTAFERSFAAAIERTAHTIHEIASMPRFREAITWQNRRALHTGVLSILKQPSANRDSQRRQHEELVARYWQRYCAKNDTIGFFGPVGWAWFTDHGAAIRVAPGPSLIKTRQVYFEGWSIDALCAALTANPALRPWLAPRAMPWIDLDGCTARLPERQQIDLSLAQAVVLRQATGAIPARDLAANVIREYPALFADERAVYAALEELVACGLIVWALEVPLSAYPERSLRQQLERIADPDGARTALAALDELEAERDRIARAAGDPERLDRALGSLETAFTRLTGASATRLAGRTYAARTLVYEDCRRDIGVELGPAFLQSLGGTLDLLLTSARWFTFEAAAIYRRVLHQIYAALAQEAGSATVAFATFWQRAQASLFGDITQDHLGYVDSIVQEHQARWATILALPAGPRRVNYTSAALREQVHERFAAPGPGWQAARYHSPDLMIAASSVDAIRRGEHQCVLGELHVAVNTLRISCFVNQHPQPAELIRAVDRDFPEPRVVLIEDKDWAEFSERSRIALIAPKDLRLAFAPNTAEPPSPQILPIGALVIEDVAGTLVVRTRDGRLHLDAIEVFADTLSILIASSWKITAPGRHTPRITIDNVVVARETWRFATPDLGFAFAKSERERFLGARRWAQSQNLPRHVFVKVPVEWKPMYVDFDSPILVDGFARLIRRTAEADPDGLRVTVTEMLPDHEQAWLPDAADQRYACELRMIAVDQAR